MAHANRVPRPDRYKDHRRLAQLESSSRQRCNMCMALLDMHSAVELNECRANEARLINNLDSKELVK